MFIKQSTASAIMVGPFVDSTDGYTLETGLSIPSGNIRLSKNGGAFALTSAGIALTHNESGWYSGTLNTTDTNTAGRLELSVYVSGALPVWRQYTVLPSMIYDSLIAGTASLTVYPTGVFSANANVTGLAPEALSQIVSSGNAALWNDTFTATDISSIVSSGNLAGWGVHEVTVTGFLASTINAAAIADNAIDIATFAADTKTGNNLNVNILAVSGDASAAVNLAKQFNLTGVTGATFPARQDQLSNIVAAGAAVNVVATGFAIFTGTETGTYSNTAARDGTYHQLTDSAGSFSGYYMFNVGADGVPTSIFIYGAATSSNNTFGIYAYDWISTSWTQIGSIVGSNVLTPAGNTFPLYTSMVATTGNVGNVYVMIRGTGLTTANMYVDQLYTSYSVVRRTVGYSDGAVWIDTLTGTAGTTPYTHGTADRPVLTHADALTLAAALGTHRFRVIGGSSIQLTASTDNNVYIGEGEWNLDLNGQSIAGSYFEGATIVGSGTGVNPPPRFVRCKIGNGSADVTLPSSVLMECRIYTTGSYATTIGSGITVWESCCSAVAGNATPRTIFTPGADFNVRAYAGGLQIEQMTSGNLMSFDCPTGQLKIQNDCTGGTIRRAGMNRLIDLGTFGGTMTDGYGMTIATDADEQVTVGTISEVALSQIVASGNAANWSGLADLTTLQSTLDTVSGNLSVVDSNVDTIVADLPVGLIASQIDVQSIQNNTRFVSSIPSTAIIPETGILIYKIGAYFYDSIGNMEDPDSDEIAVQIRAILHQTYISGMYDDEGATTPATPSVTFTGYYKLAKEDIGMYSTYITVADTELQDQWTADFALQESGVTLHYTRATLMLDEEPGTAQLAENDANKKVIADAIRENIPGMSAVEDGSIQDSIMTDGVSVTGLDPALSIDSNMISIDGQPTSGNYATLNLKQLNVVNSAGHAIIAHAHGGNYHGVWASGTGTGGHGVQAQGGNVGHGMMLYGGVLGGNGLDAQSSDGAAGGVGVNFEGRGPGYSHGIQATGAGSNGHGALIQGSADAGTGKGMYIRGNNSNGLYVEAFGAETAVQINGGDNGGHGIHIYVDGPGDAIRAEVEGFASDNGHGLHVIGHGSGNGIYAEGGISGFGMLLEGDEGDIFADEINTLQSTIDTVSGDINSLNDVSITEIIDSGNAAGWAADTTSITVSGLSPEALSQIVASGNAANWSGISDLTDINTKLDAISGYTDSLESDIAAIPGTTVTGVFDENVSGSLNFRTATTEMWSFSANDVDLTSVSSGILHTYKDPSGSDSFTLLATPSGRFRS